MRLNGGSGLREQFNWGEEMTTAMIIWTQSKQLLTILLWEEKFFSGHLSPDDIEVRARMGLGCDTQMHK